ncbi:MAG: YraN family protein [Elusimicrobiota bacterium]|jgi:putative endonuclease|nr:YraN family protein [Elusimicrobiota bacterium]
MWITKFFETVKRLFAGKIFRSKEIKKEPWTSRAEGIRRENEAVKLLKKRGYKIIERNFRAYKGEIDIIAKHKGAYVFVEVRYRSSTFAGAPVESVRKAKQLKIIKTALVYIKNHRLQDKDIRFDIVALSPQGAEVFENAFIVKNKRFFV